MKILQVIYSLCSGGAERFVVDLSNRLAQDRDNEVVILIVDVLRRKDCFILRKIVPLHAEMCCVDSTQMNV